VLNIAGIFIPLVQSHQIDFDIESLTQKTFRETEEVDNFTKI
jgi:hypothetical protein